MKLTNPMKKILLALTIIIGSLLAAAEQPRAEILCADRESGARFQLVSYASSATRFDGFLYEAGEDTPQRLACGRVLSWHPRPGETGPVRWSCWEGGNHPKIHVDINGMENRAAVYSGQTVVGQLSCIHPLRPIHH